MSSSSSYRKTEHNLDLFGESTWWANPVMDLVQRVGVCVCVWVCVCVCVCVCVFVCVHVYTFLACKCVYIWTHVLELANIPLFPVTTNPLGTFTKFQSPRFTQEESNNDANRKPANITPMQNTPWQRCTNLTPSDNNNNNNNNNNNMHRHSWNKQLTPSLQSISLKMQINIGERKWETELCLTLAHYLV